MKRIILIVPLLFILLITLDSCEFYVNKDLGNKLTVFEGDKLEDKVIVYCTGYSFGSCKSGIYVVPTYEEHYDEKGNYAEYVETAEFDDKWVVVKTIRIENQKENYWIISKDFSLDDVDCNEINCDSIIQSHVIGALDYQKFNAKTKKLGINIKFKK